MAIIIFICVESFLFTLSKQKKADVDEIVPSMCGNSKRTLTLVEAEQVSCFKFLFMPR
jgi:hypothetical protein